MKKCFFLFLLLILFSLKPGEAHADTLALGITPTIFQITANAPSEIDAPMTILNQSNQSTALDIQIQPFQAAETDNGLTQPIPFNQITGADPNLLKKIEIRDGSESINMITLAPQQKKELTLHISLPVGEPPSDYYFSILYVSKNILTNQSSVSSISEGIATNVLLSIGPQDKTKGTLDNFSTPFFQQKGPVSFKVKVTNQSKHFVVPRGTITITNMFGQTTGVVNLAQMNVLSQSSRYIADDRSGNKTQAIWTERVLFGLYKATITIALSSDGPIFQKDIYFLAIPATAIIWIFILILILLIIIERVQKKMRDKR